jgi:thymidylate synthase (FAD)
MEISLKGSTNNYTKKEEFMQFARISARHCYSEHDWETLEKETYNPDFVNGLIKGGHHSVFEHINLTFSMSGLPKIMAMILNNEQLCATSEKSARYTQMKEIQPEQQKKYDKWLGIIHDKISEIYPKNNFTNLYVKDKTGKTPAIKLAQENARYMTSVFTPTKMVHTLNLRQLNYVLDYMTGFILDYGETNEFNSRLAVEMIKFKDEIDDEFKIKGLVSQADRHLSIFGKPVSEKFDETYATNYKMSFASLAQAHRHRTINYQISKDIELNAPDGFHVPKIIRGTDFEKEWVSDLEEISKTDFPQAQLIDVTETGTLNDFRSKLILRLCGHAQHETMERTLELAKKYAENYAKFNHEWLNPKCIQGMDCSGGCSLGSQRALERRI